MFTRALLVLALAAAAVGWPVAAQAQAPAPAPQGGAPQAQTTAAPSEHPTFEVGLGYQFVRAGEICFDDDDSDCSSGYNYPLGFAIDAARNFGALGVVGELGWSRHADDVTAGTDEASLAENLFHYAAGLRVSGHNAGRFWPYGQVLIGAATIHASLDFDNDQIDDLLGDSDTRTKFMIQPGVGATFVAGDGWGVFGQVDYRRLFLDEDEDGASGRNDWRVFVGVRAILD